MLCKLTVRIPRLCGKNVDRAYDFSELLCNSGLLMVSYMYSASRNLHVELKNSCLRSYGLKIQTDVMQRLWHKI